MKTTIHFLAAIILFGFTSCQESHPDDDKFITIPIKEVKNSSESFSNFITGIKTIQLETNRNCLIGNIEEFRLYNDDIYILESPGSLGSPGSLKRILRFNSEGDFICEIGDYGRGPEELISPRDFIFEEDKIEIWSRYKISRHTIDGDFIENAYSIPLKNPLHLTENNELVIAYFHHDLDNPEARKDKRLPTIEPDDNPLLIKFQIEL